MTDYAVIYEQANDGTWSASAVGLPVFAAGDTREEAEKHMREGIALHLDHIREQAEAEPPAYGTVGVVSV